MKPVILTAPKILWFSRLVGIRASAMTLWPFIFTVKDVSERTIRHEKIHIAQCNELLVVGFYAVYVWDFFAGLLRHRDAWRAYRMIRFEREAYEHEDEMEYLRDRERFGWRKCKTAA